MRTRSPTRARCGSTSTGPASCRRCGRCWPASPCHLLIESAGSGGVHAYWQLDRPLSARSDAEEAAASSPRADLERAHLRLIHHLGVDHRGKPNVADPACFPAGTLVLTDAGYLPIEQINVGDRVLTHMGRWRRVTATMRREADTVTVTGHGHPGLETTAAHPFLSRTRQPRWRGGPFAIGTVEWTPAERLAGRFWASITEIERLPVPPVSGRGMEFTTEFWWLIGRWLGDGNVQRRKPHASRRGEQSGACFRCCCGHGECEALSDRLERFAPPPNRRSPGVENCVGCVAASAPQRCSLRAMTA